MELAKGNKKSPQNKRHLLKKLIKYAQPKKVFSGKQK